jgi:hypothetical protein
VKDYVVISWSCTKGSVRWAKWINASLELVYRSTFLFKLAELARAECHVHFSIVCVHYPVEYTTCDNTQGYNIIGLNLLLGRITKEFAIWCDP